MSKPKPEFDFQITHQKGEDGRHFLIVSPSKVNEGYGPVSVEVTEKTWDELRFTFATAVDDINKMEKLTYIC
jgi:hypothetical protein